VAGGKKALLQPLLYWPATGTQRTRNVFIRSTIANLERVREIETLFQGDCVLILQDGTRLNAGRAYRKNLDELVGKGG
jgi:DNA-binding LytR/AlgR family response regulator